MVELLACHTSNDKLNGGDVDPGLGTLDGGFEVFGKAAVAIEPGEGTFDDPSAREHFEANRIGHAPNDFDAPSAEFDECFKELIARIGTVGEEVAQPRKEVVDGFDNEWRSVAVLHKACPVEEWGRGGSRRQPTVRWYRSRYDACGL
jgi:hypothetical protein